MYFVVDIFSTLMSKKYENIRGYFVKIDEYMSVL